MQDVLCCWDFLLATHLEYVDSFFISMLLEQRVSILNGDAGHILTILMRLVIFVFLGSFLSLIFGLIHKC